MKKIYLFAFTIISLAVNAQSPTVEGTYLPVRGTVVKEVWDTITNDLPVPAAGTNMNWDYSLGIFNPTDTFQIRTFHPDTANKNFTFPNWVTVQLQNIVPTGTTHTSVLRSPSHPKFNLIDSLVNFYNIDTAGLHLIGGYNFKKTINAKFIANPSKGELIIPQLVTHQSPAKVIYDTANIYGTSPAYYIAQYNVYRPAKLHTIQRKIMTTLGYGTLVTPAGTFKSTILARETFENTDSIAIDFLNNGSYSFKYNQNSTLIRYSFFSNNTFGSSVSLLMVDNNSDNTIDYGWYTLPVEFGSISGSVMDSSGALLTAGNNDVYLYRENSNFSKNDILVKTKVDANGNYKFDSIPFGLYRIAVRPDAGVYPNSLTTYYGDTTSNSSANWLNAATVGTLNCKCNKTGIDLKLKYHAPATGNGHISGNILTNYSFGALGRFGFNSPLIPFAAKSIPGVDVIVKTKPGGTASVSSITDQNGSFSMANLNDGTYDLFVDMPGLSQTGTHEFTITGGTVVSGLDFTVSLDSIFPEPNVTTSIKQNTSRSPNGFIVYPNPTSSSSTSVTFTTATNDHVSLEVFNSIGQRITTLENAHKQAGSYTYDLKLIAPGMYFVKLSSGAKQYIQSVIRQ